MLADIIVIAILVVIVALVIRTIIKSKKAGKSLQCGSSWMVLRWITGWSGYVANVPRINQMCCIASVGVRLKPWIWTPG